MTEVNDDGSMGVHHGAQIGTGNAGKVYFFDMTWKTLKWDEATFTYIGKELSHPRLSGAWYRTYAPPPWVGPPVGYARHELYVEREGAFVQNPFVYGNGSYLAAIPVSNQRVTDEIWSTTDAAPGGYEFDQWGLSWLNWIDPPHN